MSKVSVHLAESLHQQAAAVATAEGVSMDQFIATAVAEKIADLQAVDYLKERASAAVVKALGGLGEGSGCGARKARSALSVVECAGGVG